MVGVLDQHSAPNPATVVKWTGVPPSSATATTSLGQPPADTAADHPPGSHRDRQAPTTSKRRSATAPVSAPAGADTGTAMAPAPSAVPVHLRIPAIGVDTDLIVLGLNPDGSLAVPPSGADYDKAAWFNGSPAPGDVGPAVIEGHIDSAADGPSVFFDLGALEPGDLILVDRADGSTVSFATDFVGSYPKNRFPELTVYGNTTGPELRLITCGGDFDAATGSYLNNTVVYSKQA